jgi:Ca-activated chloride channel family protein
MRIAHPHLLWLLLAVPIAVLAYAVTFAQRRRLLDKLGNGPMIQRMVASTSVARKVVRAVEVVAALALIALALARPQVGGRAKLTKQPGLDLVVALDFSRSMLAKDVYPSRLERAKRELERLLDRLGGDRIGLVAFAGETLTYPPTTDYAALKLFWRDLYPWDMPVGGTAIGRAMRSGLELLTRIRAQGGATRAQVMLLLTDGEDNDSEPLEVADQASKLGVKVFTVGIGSRSGELIPEFDEKGQIAGYLKDNDGKYVTSRLDEATLTKIAEKTGGEYFHADPKRFGVEEVESALAGLKRSENEARVVKQYDEIYEILLLPAFLLLVGEACSSDRRRRRLAAAVSGDAQVGGARRERS